jgi:hypothetical protein
MVMNGRARTHASGFGRIGLNVCISCASPSIEIVTRPLFRAVDKLAQAVAASNDATTSAMRASVTCNSTPPIRYWPRPRCRSYIRYHGDVTTLVRPERPNDHDLDGLRARLAELEAILAERSTDAARTQADLAAFRIRYRAEVGLLHDELDRLELALAEAELGEISKRVAEAGGPEPPPAAIPPEPQPRFTSDAVRKLFRDVAKTIHPDLARDEATRDRRHSLMIKANRAYAMGDEEELRAILQAWDRSPEAVQGDDAEAMRLRLVRRIAQIEEQLEGLAGALADVKASALWKLKVMVDDEAAKGNDLIKDMVRRLKRDILVATNRLDALRPPQN